MLAGSGRFVMAFRTNRLAGFSLAESLVALAIAALLAAALTRFVSNTRMNAGKVDELIEMMALGDSLLEHVSQKTPETSDGRAGRFTWHIDVVPMAISAVSRKLAPKKNPAAGQSGPTTAGLATAESTSGSDNSIMEPATAPPQDPVKWMPVHVTILVKSQSGRKYVTDTVSITSQLSKK
jgi:prepilin-type N-terminal cleavage/methylation domain-containing protein